MDDKKKREADIHVLWLPVILILGILYIVSFVDFLPDTIPLFGQLDDVVVAVALVWFFTSWLPKNRHRIYWFRRQTGARASQTTGAGGNGARREEGIDPFEVLKVNRGASQDEIKHAYRVLMAKYHPDKVNHLGEEFQRLAHAKVVKIAKAYEMLIGKE